MVYTAARLPINLARRCVACGMSNALRVHLVLGPLSFGLRLLLMHLFWVASNNLRLAPSAKSDLQLVLRFTTGNSRVNASVLEENFK